MVVGADQATVGQRLPGSGLRLHGVRLRLDPNRQLTASDGAAGNFFGTRFPSAATRWWSGRTRPRSEASTQGAAYVFTESGSAWTQTAELTPSDGEAGDGFGGSVPISGDTIVVGATRHAIGGNADQGAAYVGPWPLPSVTGRQSGVGSACGRHVGDDHGDGLYGRNAVDFGSTRGGGNERSGQLGGPQITATSPAGAGTVNVMVVTPEARRTLLPADEFTYLAVPAVTGLSVSDGLLAGWYDGDDRRYGPDRCSGRHVRQHGSDRSQRHVHTDRGRQPDGKRRHVDVTVTTAAGTSAASATDEFAYTPLALTNSSSTIFTAGRAGSFSMTTGSADATFSVVNGTLPTGVNLTTAGLLTGTPAAGTVGIFPIVITATDGVSPPQHSTLP